MQNSLEAQRYDPLQLAADLVSTYVANNSMPASELTSLLVSVHTTISNLGESRPAETSNDVIEKPTPAQIKKSITPDHLISFEDGKSYKTLRRHLNLRGLTAESYREKYGLPFDYPMTSATYSARRSELARSLGLGDRVNRKASAKAAVPDDTVMEPPKRRGRPPKAT